jgi:hypothetical protein
VYGWHFMMIHPEIRKQEIFPLYAAIARYTWARSVMIVY